MQNTPKANTNKQTTLLLEDPERPESKYIYTKDELRGDFLRPPHKHLTPATVYINKFW